MKLTRREALKLGLTCAFMPTVASLARPETITFRLGFPSRKGKPWYLRTSLAEEDGIEYWECQLPAECRDPKTGEVVLQIQWIKVEGDRGEISFRKLGVKKLTKVE